MLDGLLKDFYLISGMEISLLNADFHSISICRGDTAGFCSVFHRTQKGREICRESDIEHLTLAKHTAAPTVYSCPCGIIEAILPIIKGDAAVAYLFCSMGIRDDAAENKIIAEQAAELVPDADRRRMESAIKDLRRLTEEQINAYLTMLKLLAEHISAADLISDGGESIGKLVKYYVKRNLARKLTLSDIAMSLHCSTVTLTENFRKEFGITIMDYVTKKRMELAERLLLSGDEPLREIAANVGYSDVEYFSRSFKRYHGTSPDMWRKTAKTGAKER